MARKPKKPIEVKTLTHDEASRKNIPTAEFQSVMRDEEKSPIQLAYERRNRDLDPQLVWRGKDEQDWSDLVVHAPPLYIQEKVHPKVLIDDLLKETKERADQDPPDMPDLFADFNGLPDKEATTEFYAHDANWTNRLILGDSLSVMASLAEREGLRGQVQCIYFDPPYGIKFNSNFQWSTTSRDVKDGKAEHISREPEQVKAFRDTWRDGIHSYLTYLRDRLTVARDLLSESGSIFVQIGDENLHRARALLDEIFGEDNFVSIIQVQKTGSMAANMLANTVDFIIWFAKSKEKAKYRQLYNMRVAGHVSSDRYDQIELVDGTERRLRKDELERNVEIPEGRIFQHTSLISSGQASVDQTFDFCGKSYRPTSGSHWKTTVTGLGNLARAGRVAAGATTIRYKRFLDDFAVLPITDRWESLQIGTGLIYVVQTSPSVIDRCILMTTDPGDLVLDPTCGSGTTAYVAEQRGRRWITIDTSRVALALARARIMGARYPYYLLADSPEGQQKEAEVTRSVPSEAPTRGDIRQGFVYERVPHITLKSIANNAEIDVIWEKSQETLEPLREQLNSALGKSWEEWEIPREVGDDWPAEAKTAHAKWWKARIERQTEIDASIAAKADFEYLYDKPYTDNTRIRVAGPFTAESLSPHRVLAVDQDDELVDVLDAAEGRHAAPSRSSDEADFASVMLEHLKTSGVQQAHKEDRISHSAICAEAEKFGSYFTHGYWDYRDYDLENTKYVICFGGDPIASNRMVPNAIRQWGKVLDQATVAVVDPRLSATASKAHEWLPVKAGEDSALACAMAHVILTEGLWNREFVGDFKDGKNMFVAGAAVDEAAFDEKLTNGVVKWWNIELKDRTPEWAEKVCLIPAAQIRRVAVGFGKAAPNVMCWMAPGASMQPRGAYGAFAAHALNGLVGGIDNAGGVLQKVSAKYTHIPLYKEKFKPYLDEIAQKGLKNKKIDQRGTLEFPSLKKKPGGGVVTNRTADGILDENPNEIKVAIGYWNNFVFSCTGATRWEKAMEKVPFFAHITTNPAKFTQYADVVLPASFSMFERWSLIPSKYNRYSYIGLQQPVVKPLWDTRTDETEVVWLLAKKLKEKGFPNLFDYFQTEMKDPETGKPAANEAEFAEITVKIMTEKQWNPAKYHSGEKFDGWQAFRKTGLWQSDQYAFKKLWKKGFKTKTKKFEFYSETLKDVLGKHAKKHGVDIDKVMEVTQYAGRGEQVFVPHWEPSKYHGDEKEYPFVYLENRSRLNREGRSQNMPSYYEFKKVDPGDTSHMDVLKINPKDGQALGLKNGDWVKVTSPEKSVKVQVKLWEGVRPGTVNKTFGMGHWAYGRVAAGDFGKHVARGYNTNELLPADYDRLSGSTARHAVSRVKIEKA